MPGPDKVMTILRRVSFYNGRMDMSRLRIRAAGLVALAVAMIAGTGSTARAQIVEVGNGGPGPVKAEHLLHANSILGPSAFYAVLTGIFLWASSLVGARLLCSWKSFVNERGAVGREREWRFQFSPFRSISKDTNYVGIALDYVILRR